MTDMPIEPDRLERLRTRVLAGPLVSTDAPQDEREAAFAGWWFRAARLAALGDDAPFRNWPAIAGTCGADAVHAISQAARIGLRILGDGAGESLAEAIIDAEDAACLLEAESRSTALLPTLRPVIEGWLHAAGDAVLDEAAAEILDDHRDAYPLPESLRLPIVQTPLTELELLAAAASADWSRPVRLAPVFEFEEAAALFHDGPPTEAMQRCFEGRQGDGVTPSGSFLRVLPKLDDYWAVIVTITGEAARRVRSVRIGTWPLQRVDDAELGVEGTIGAGLGDPDDPYEGGTAIFEASLAGLPFQERLRLIRSDIGVTTGDGGRFLL
jgi:hypothetical protein